MGQPPFPKGSFSSNSVFNLTMNLFWYAEEMIIVQPIVEILIAKASLSAL
jgi:hypothetical protein